VIDKLFPDAESARLYLESRRWPNGVCCPICESDRIGQHSPGYYRCDACKEAFTVRTGTIFGRSHVPLHKWVYAMYYLLTAREGISSLKLSKEIGITQKSAWFVRKRLREACGKDLTSTAAPPRPPEELVGALHDRVHGERGTARAAKSVRTRSKHPPS